MNFSTILCRKENGIFYLSLNRPQTYNALTIELLKEIAEALNSAENDREVGSIVLSGEGKGFCSGQDLSIVNELKSISASEVIEKYYTPVILGIVHCQKPVICKLTGKAAGAGFALAMSCDIIIASDNSVLVPGFNQIGLMPDSGITYFLLQILGPKRTFEILGLGSALTANQAKELNLINQIVPESELNTAVEAFAQNLNSQSGKNLAMLKSLLSEGINKNLEDILRMEASMQDKAIKHDDFREGVSAFLEKRKPEFKRC
jgi:2-(1,2-epoxy-1,2-dihydrophenyl)acetyl-CoA isomerase